MPTKNYFITVEGIEGAGKTTAMISLSDWLQQANVPYLVTREPGGTPIANSIRNLLLTQHDEAMCPETELLLMFAARAQNLTTNIRPALAAGKWVICDRFTDASYAYQGGGRGIPIEKIATLEQWVHADLQPDMVILLDVPVEIGLKRIASRQAKDRIEHEQIEFFERVRATYFRRAMRYPERYRVIDASGDLASVTKQLHAIMKPLLTSA